jgi:hypothetical protein
MRVSRCLSPDDVCQSSLSRRKSRRMSVPGRKSRRLCNWSDPRRQSIPDRKWRRSGVRRRSIRRWRRKLMNCEVPGHSGKRAGHELLCTVGRHESHARLQPLVVVSQDRPVLDNHLLFSPRGFVDGVPALTGSRQSKKNDSLPSSAPVSDELLRKRPKSKRRTPGRVALPSSYAIAVMHFDDSCKVGSYTSCSSRGQHAFRGAASRSRGC